MSDLNCFSFTGRLTQDATVRTLASGKKVVTANAAVNTGYGEYKKTLFVKLQMWGDHGEKVVQYLTKGKYIAASGELSRSEWQTREGKQMVDFVVDVRAINLVGSKPQEQAGQQNAPDANISDFPDNILY